MSVQVAFSKNTRFSLKLGLAFSETGDLCHRNAALTFADV